MLRLGDLLRRPDALDNRRHVLGRLPLAAATAPGLGVSAGNDDLAVMGQTIGATVQEARRVPATTTNGEERQVRRLIPGERLSLRIIAAGMCKPLIRLATNRR
jgi:hypothetical protein